MSLESQRESSSFRSLCAELAAELDHNRRCLLDDASLTHPLADRARAALAKPVAEPPAPPAEGEVAELIAQLRSRHYGPAALDRAAELLERHAAPVPVPVAEPPAVAKGEVAKLVAQLHELAEVQDDDGWEGDAVMLRRAAELLERHAAPVPVPVAEPPAVAEQPSDDELGLIYHDCCRGCEFMDQGGFEDAARAVLARWGQPPAPPADYIDPEHSGTNREMLEVFYSATLREGGTADEIALRGINAVLARWGRPAQPAPPAEGEIDQLVSRLRDYAQGEADNGWHDDAARFRRAAELLERHAAPVPVPVSERLPGSEDCDAEWRCWLTSTAPGAFPGWILDDPEQCVDWDLWLPAHALPLPQGGEVEP